MDMLINHTIDCDYSSHQLTILNPYIVVPAHYDYDGLDAHHNYGW